ncbi:hypothetical protein [Catenovulum sediminis]|uniref:Carboxymuconolactone decarboxylase-like domain-containing protein n=1 Tax=Catenovulum sediminis TaxID=1740262 RepID=A0ABV1RKB6_9ALTE
MDLERDKQDKQLLAAMAVAYGFYSPVATAVKDALANWGRV